MRKTDEGGGPLKLMRQRLGITLAELAVISNMSYARAWDVEHGLVSRIPPGMVAALRGLGLDVEELQFKYADWRQAKAKAVRERVMAQANV